MSAEVFDASEVDNSQDGEVLNGNVLFSKESTENSQVKENRIIKRAKRPSKLSPKKDETVLVNGVSHVTLGNKAIPNKNSRKSRNGRGRGLPKKGGGGGKGVWGVPGVEMLEVDACNDARDPNYDSDSQDRDIVVKKTELPLTLEEIEKTVSPLLQEYFEHGDTEEVVGSLEELNYKDNRYRVVEMAVGMALDRHDPQREMASRLISDLYGRFLSQEDIAKSFDELLGNIGDLVLDTPEVPVLLGQFIARAVADDCLPPKYVGGYKGHVDNQLVRDALDKADVLLSMKHGIVRLDNVWGVGGGNRPVKYLKKRMVLLLKEYLSSGDINEATRCLKELDVPHFHHELVYEALTMAIEESSDTAVDKMVKLLKNQAITNVITPDQLRQGVKRVYTDMPDICVDVPTAYAWLERLGNKMYEEKILAEDLYQDLPSRGRKRFVSEGDGGKVKEQSLK